MFKKVDREVSRERRHLRVRKKISGTPERLRLSVYGSEKNMYAQIIDDANPVTLASAPSLDKVFDTEADGNKGTAEMVSGLIAKKALEKGISEVVFDGDGYVYHGRAQALAEVVREAGLKS